MTDKERSMNMRNKIMVTVGILIILAGIICGGIGIKSYLDEKNAGKDYEKIKSEITIATPEPTPVQEETEEIQEPEPTKEPLVIPVDLEGLMEKYPDVYAWIRIPGTDIDYPILQKEGDNSYYLNHTVEGKKKIEGAIFTEDYNTKDFTDPNTVIYGHNMKNGSMFRQLHKYEDRSFFQDNREVLIYQTDQILHYHIFAAYTYDDRHLMQSFDFNNPDVFEGYIGSILDLKGMSNNIDDSVDITGEDKIITLSTCNGNSNQRYIVQAVLLSIEN